MGPRGSSLVSFANCFDMAQLLSRILGRSVHINTKSLDSKTNVVGL